MIRKKLIVLGDADPQPLSAVALRLEIKQRFGHCGDVELADGLDRARGAGLIVPKKDKWTGDRVWVLTAEGRGADAR